jgi:chromate transport protein ChrA
MINLKVVIVTAVLLILAIIAFDAVTRLIDNLDDVDTVREAALTIIFIFIFAYFAMSILNISLSVFLGILLAKLVLEYFRRTDSTPENKPLYSFRLI